MYSFIKQLFCNICFIIIRKRENVNGFCEKYERAMSDCFRIGVDILRICMI